MKRSIACAPFALLVIGCGDESGTASFYAEAHPPLRSPCQASDIPMLMVAKMACFDIIPSPETKDPEFFSDGREPSSSRTESLDGLLIDTKDYDYSKPFEFPHAMYDDDDNIISVSFPENFPMGDGPVIEYEYRDATLIGAVAVTGTVREAETEILYEGGLRASDGLKTSQKSRWFYKYDSDGRLLHKRGGSTPNNMPETPNEEAMELGCNATVPAVNVESDGVFGLVGTEYYFRDDDGRITTVIAGLTPGLKFQKYTFEWSGDTLASATLHCSDLHENSPRKVTYSY